MIWSSLLLAMVMFIGSTLYLHDRHTPKEVEARIKRAFPGQSRVIFENATQITIYSLDGDMRLDNAPHLSPTSAPGQFHGYPILGKVNVTGDEAKNVVNWIYGGFTKRRVINGMCFEPHHGLRAATGSNTVDVVICFGCTNMHIFSKGTESNSALSRSPEKYLNQLLTAAGVPFAPDYKP